MAAARETRHALIAIARRRQRPGSGSSLEFLRRRTAEMQWPDLTPVLQDILWAAIGAVATRAYMPERVTRDLDAAIRAEDAPRARERLQQAGWRHVGELSVGGSRWADPTGQEVDIVELADGWTEEAIALAQANRDQQGLPILPLPYLVLTKLRAGRVQDVADISRMLGQATEEQLQAVRDVVATYSPEDLEDVESLAALGRRELE